jgi:hypothetical protein
MRSVLRIGVFVALVAGLGAGLMPEPIRAVQTTAVDPALKTRVERRFRVLPVRDGVVLTPRREVPGLQSIEIRDGIIAVDGAPTTGAQLRERLGADADLVLQVSYLPSDTLAQWAGPPPAPAPPAPTPEGDTGRGKRPEGETPGAERAPDADERPDIHWRKSSAKVHIGSSIVVGEDELVTDPVVAVGGSVTVLGRVDDDVVAVGGSVRLGPKARVRGDVTAVGGRVDQERGAVIGGTVNEIRFGPQFDIKPWHVFEGWWFPGLNVVGGGFRLLGTVMRISIVLLLVFIVALIAMRPMERIGERAGREPWLSGFTGLLAQLLFVPVLVLTVVVLAVSIIGIPLLFLVPFAVMAFLLAVLVGFAGVAWRLGRWAVGDARAPFVALAVGVVLVSAVALLARTLSLLPVPLWPITWFVAVIGFFVEYAAWTVGLGAALLTRFGTRGTRPIYEPPGPPPIPVTTGPIEP